MNADTLNHIAENFHFIYPDWLWLLLPLLIVLLWLGKSKPDDSLLHKLVDPKLAPFVLVGESGGNSRRLLWLTALLYLIAVIAMAGPSWDKLKQAAYKKDQAVVVALDLSRSMYATDVQPSRLVRARFELIDLLKQRKEGQTGLVVYAGDAFGVSPLTDDTDNIESQVKLLTPNIMPVQGSQAALAIRKAMQLLEQAEVKKGQILLVTDEIADSQAAIAAAKDANSAGMQVSVLSVGTEEGSPISLPRGGFIKDPQGNIVLAKTNPSIMQKLSQAGGGLFVKSDVGDQDLTRLEVQFSSNSSSNLVKDEDQEVESWINEGAWLIFLLLPLALLVFRKGYLVSVLLVSVALSQPEPVMAMSWDDLWLTPDQQGQRALDKGDFKVAAEKFVNPNWKGVAEYKQGNYEKAEESFSKDDSAEGLYNRGNAFAQLNKKDEAKTAYREVLKKNKDHEDAKYNLMGMVECTDEEIKNDPEKCKEIESPPKDKPEPKSSDSENCTEEEIKNNDPKCEDKEESSGQDQEGEGQESDQKKPSDSNEGEEGDNAQSAQDKAAEEAEKKALEEWKKQQETDEDKKEDGDAEMDSKELSDQQKEQLQATEQWLRRIPDDPSGLWQRKFQYQYGRRNQQRSVGKSW